MTTLLKLILYTLRNIVCSDIQHTKELKSDIQDAQNKVRTPKTLLEESSQIPYKIRLIAMKVNHSM